MPTSIDIILPCYQPSSNWAKELFAFHEALNQRYNVTYIIVNDGSSGNYFTEQLKWLTNKNIPFEFISYDVNKGKGFALRKGIQKSTANYVMYTDCDFPFTQTSMFELLNSLVSQQFDIFVGYRNNAYYEKKMSLFRKILSKAFRFFVKRILKMPITDTQCGLKAFNTKGKTKFLETTIDRYLFDFEFIYMACKDKELSILPVQVQLKENIIFSKMKLKVVVQELINLARILILK